jgi:hypothetical protein
MASLATGRRCKMCGQTAGGVMVCTCKHAYYCSSACQRSDYATHKEECKRVRHNQEMASDACPFALRVRDVVHAATDERMPLHHQPRFFTCPLGTNVVVYSLAEMSELLTYRECSRGLWPLGCRPLYGAEAGAFEEYYPGIGDIFHLAALGSCDAISQSILACLPQAFPHIARGRFGTFMVPMVRAVETLVVYSEAPMGEFRSLAQLRQAMPEEDVIDRSASWDHRIVYILPDPEGVVVERIRAAMGADGGLVALLSEMQRMLRYRNALPDGEAELALRLVLTANTTSERFVREAAMPESIALFEYIATSHVIDGSSAQYHEGIQENLGLGSPYVSASLGASACDYLGPQRVLFLITYLLKGSGSTLAWEG